MKRIGNLWDKLISFEHLLAAAKKAMRGKRDKANVIRFAYHFETELLRLQEQLQSQTWTPGEFHQFQILRPKPRIISAAPFRDRVVHHALCATLAEVIEPTFIEDSYANRTGKGSHLAVRKFQKLARTHRFVLTCDIRKYFPSIDHIILKEIIRRKIRDEKVLWLSDRIIDHSNEQEEIEGYFPGDDLFTRLERPHGLPLGNQTSQFFANAYLNPFDHWVKETLGAKHYLRYVDDFVIFGNDSGSLAEAREQIREVLLRWRLRLHPRKAVISRTEDGTRWLGYRIWPTHILLPRVNVVRMQRRLRWLDRESEAGRLTAEQWCRAVVGWEGHAKKANTHRLRQWIFRDAS
jgi:retron-type reverse transcriptase